MVGFNHIWLNAYEPGRRSETRYLGQRKHRFAHVGAGVAVGYQVLFGANKRGVTDFSAGLRVVSPVPEPRGYWTEGDITGDPAHFGVRNMDWYLFGLGSILDLHFSLGWRF